MEELLTKYTITEIVIFIVFLAVVVKEVVTFALNIEKKQI